MKLLIQLLMIFILCNISIIVCSESFDYQTLEKNLKSYEMKINNLKQSIDNSVFNGEETIINLDFDAENLIAYLQDEYVFQSYVGLLRGVQGTLNSRAGNALDQSVLLAKLLNDAGLETRIANGILSDELVVLLLSGLGNADIPKHIGKGDAFKKAVNSVSKDKLPKKVDLQKSETFTRYKQALTTVQNTLKENNISLKTNDITRKLFEDSKDYFWVEYRIGQSDNWHNAHPAFAKDSTINVKALSYFKDKVPEKYLHQVKLEAFIQQRIGDKYHIHSLMKPWIKPASNLQNFLITYSNAPSGINLKSDYNLDKIMEKATFFTPTLNGRAVGGKVFDLKGRLIDAEAMSSPMGGLFKTLGDKTLLAMDTIDGKKKGESSMQLTAQWLQFTFINPNGDEFVQKRYIYQSNNKNKQDKKSAKIQLLTEYSLLVNTGEQPESYLAKVYLDLVSAGLPLLKASSRKVFNDDGKTVFPKSIPRSEFELLTQYYWMNNNPNLSEDTIRYRANANMLGFKRGYVDANTAFLAVDIIANKQQFIDKKGDKLFSNPHAAFKQGMWETASEWLPAKVLKLKGNSIDTLKVTAVAQKQNHGLTIFQAKDSRENELNTIFAHDLITLSRIKSDMDLGYLIAMPIVQPQDLAMTGWWRIDPKTGETLGMISNGGGSEVTEYLIQNAQIALTLIRAVGNLKKCEKKTNDLDKLCCLAEAHFNNVGGLAFGGALGGVVGTAGAALFDIADFTTELITEGMAGKGNGRGITPSTNGKLCAGIDFPDF